METVKQNKQLMEIWDTEENKKQNIFPENISLGSSKIKINWKDKYGHKWQRAVSVQLRAKNICPICAGKKIIRENSFATLYPEILKDWDYEKNTISPFEISPKSGRKAWWKCFICGFNWQTRIDHRTQNGTGCPECSKSIISQKKQTTDYQHSLANFYPELLSEWDYNKNDKKPSEVYAHSSYNAWWKCEFGHSWQAKVHTRTRKKPAGCPICLKRYCSSFPEQAIYYYFQQITEAINRDQSFGREKEIDIYCPELKIGIEYNRSFFHRNEKTEDKISFFKEKGIRLIVVTDAKENKVDNDYIYHKETDEDLSWAVKEIFKIIQIEPPLIDISNDRNFILDNYMFSMKERSLLAKVPDVVYQWDYEKNYPLKPEQFLPKSRFEVYWKCSKRHSWKQRICNKISSQKGNYHISQCSICKPIKGGFKLSPFSSELTYEREG